MKHGVGRSGMLECGVAILNKVVTRGFAVKVTVEEKPRSGKEVYYAATEKGLHEAQVCWMGRRNSREANVSVVSKRREKER